ncbi:MAG: ribosome silencing factor [Deltaproteobacteria bacterium]|nr:MAG: ribosome silencing factor [Deltaproteobacteria bacterium]
MKRSDRGQRREKRVEELESLGKAVLCAQVAAAHKAANPLIFHVAEISSLTDYFVICSGRSTRHVQGIAQHIEKALRKRRVKPIGVEGISESQWVLLDFDDVVVHVFYEPMRSLYDLEGLWWEARQVEFAEVQSSRATRSDRAETSTGQVLDD